MLIYRITVPLAKITVPAPLDTRTVPVSLTRTVPVSLVPVSLPRVSYYYFSVRKFFISYSLSFPWYQE
jgi:hypothetical protein